MKILHINTYDFGGAAAAASRIHFGLKKKGIDSKMLVLRRTAAKENVEEFVPVGSVLSRLRRGVINRLVSSEFNRYRDGRRPGAEIFTGTRTPNMISRHALVKSADIIHLHWIAQMIDYEEFFSNMRSKKVIWTLHDMNPFTGGCHYSGTCDRYKTGCGLCPQLGSRSSGDLSRKIFNRKKNSYKKHHIRIVTPSAWLAKCAKESQLFKSVEISVIPNGLSTSIFVKRDKQHSRALFGLPPDKTLIFFASGSGTERKGLGFLVQAIKSFKESAVLNNSALIVFNDVVGLIPPDIGMSVYAVKNICDEIFMSCLYSAADVVAVPSLDDNFPNTILESFACGTPVVAFGSGGIPEMVRSGGTGFIVEAGDSDGLAGVLKWMIDYPGERQAMGENARLLAAKEYTDEIQAGRYLNLYKSL